MSEELKTEGKYELYRSIDGRKILNLDNEAYYELGEEKENGFMSYSEPDPAKDSSFSTGKYYFAGKDNESGSNGSFKLFLEDGSEFRELQLPEGLPLKRDEPRKKLISTDNRISEDKVLDQVKE